MAKKNGRKKSREIKSGKNLPEKISGKLWAENLPANLFEDKNPEKICQKKYPENYGRKICRQIYLKIKIRKKKAGIQRALHRRNICSSSERHPY